MAKENVQVTRVGVAAILNDVVAEARRMPVRLKARKTKS